VRMPSVSVILPVLLHNERDLIMTRACIDILFATTKAPFELVVVESGTNRLRGCPKVAQHLLRARAEGSSYVKDFNAGIEASTGEILVHTANDVIMSDGWLEAILAVFAEYPDAGAVSPVVVEPGATLGPAYPEQTVSESFTGCCFAFKRGFWLDDGFQDTFSDNDLAMQIYNSGLRCYRTNAVVVRHLKEMTIYEGVAREKKQADFVAGARRFREKWAGKPWLIKQVLTRGGVAYGKETEPMFPWLDG
jgi:Glycosyl transferase family 2